MAGAPAQNDPDTQGRARSSSGTQGARTKGAAGLTMPGYAVAPATATARQGRLPTELLLGLVTDGSCHIIELPALLLLDDAAVIVVFPRG